MRVWIDGKNLAGTIGEIADGLGERLREQALAVVLDNDGIDLREQRLNLRERGGGMLRLQAQLLFAIDAYHVLLPRDDARLHDGLVALVRLHGVDVDAFAGEQFLELFGMRAKAGDAEDSDVFGEFREVACDVRRAAGKPFLADDLDDGHGSLRRNARDFAPQEFVEHEIADDQDALVGERVDEGGNAVATHLASSSVMAAKSNGIMIS